MKTTARHKRLSILLVFCCTLIGATAQVLLKFGASGLNPHPTPVDTVIRIFTSPALFTGYALYGVSTILLVLALRHGELSLLYPVLALTFVWVTILSVVIFHEPMNPLKIGGILVIMSGVAILGKGSAITP